jgi:hypothetical protein
MSTIISAKVPTIEVLTGTPSELNATAAIGHLLNITSFYNPTLYANAHTMAGYASVSKMSEDILFSTASNKSLFIFDRSNLTGVESVSASYIDHSNVSLYESATFSLSGSDIIVSEDLFLKVTSPDNGKINTNNTNIYLNELATANQDEMIAQDHIRVLNNIIGDASISYNSTAALGIENYAYKFNGSFAAPDYSSINTDSLSSRDLQIIVSDVSTIPSWSTYKIYNDNASFVLVNTDDRVYKDTNTLVSNVNVTGTGLSLLLAAGDIPATTRSFTLNIAAGYADDTALLRTFGPDNFFLREGTGMNNTSSLVTTLPKEFNVTVEGRVIELIQDNNSGTNYFTNASNVTLHVYEEDSSVYIADSIITFDSSNRHTFNTSNTDNITMTATVDYTAMEDSYKNATFVNWSFERAAKILPFTTTYDPAGNNNITSSLNNGSDIAFIARVDAANTLILSKEYSQTTLYAEAGGIDNIVVNSASDLNISGSVTNTTDIIDWRIRFDSNVTSFTNGLTTQNMSGNITLNFNVTAPFFSYTDMNGPLLNKEDYFDLYDNNKVSLFNQRYCIDLPRSDLVNDTNKNVTSAVRPTTLHIQAFNNNTTTTMIPDSRDIQIAPYHGTSVITIKNETLVNDVYSVTYELDSHLSLIADDAVRVSLTISYPVRQASRKIEIGRVKLSDFGLFKTHTATFQQQTSAGIWNNLASLAFDLRGDNVNLGGGVTNLKITRNVETSSDHSYIIHLKSDETATVYTPKLLLLTAENITAFAKDNNTYDYSLLDSVSGLPNVSGTDNGLTSPGQTTRTISFSKSGVSISYTYKDEPLDNSIMFANIPKVWVKGSSATSPPATKFPLQEVVNETYYALGGGSGVEVKFTNANGGNDNVKNIGTISLNRDKYSVDTNPTISNTEIPYNLILIPTGPTVGVTTQWYRGFHNGLQFTVERDNPVNVLVQRTESNDTIHSYATVSINNADIPYQYNLGSGYSFTIKKIPVLNAKTAVYTPQKSTLYASFVSTDYNYTGTGTISNSLAIKDIFNTSEAEHLAAKIWNLFHLNNYYLNGQILNITYTQDNIVISQSANYKVNDFANVLNTVSNFNDYITNTTIDQAYTGNQVFDSRYTLKVNSSYKPAKKTSFYTVAPVVASVCARTGNNVTSKRYIELDALDGNNSSKSVEFTVNNRTAKYYLTSNILLGAPVKSYTSRNFDFRQHVFTVSSSASLLSGTEIGAGITSYSFDQIIPITSLSTSVAQAETQIMIDWSSLYFPRSQYQTGEKYKIGTVEPEDNIRLTAYQLGFNITNLNVTAGTSTLLPVVDKYTSRRYSNKLIVSGRVREFEIDTTVGANVRYSLNTTLTNSIDYPYKNCMSAYPTPSSILSVTDSPFTSFSNLNITTGSKIDLVIRVDDSATARDAYYKLVAPTSENSFNVLKMDAKDQFVVKDYMNNLSMRIGPNGRLYVGDVSSYTFAIYSNTVGGQLINSPYLPLHNSTVALGDGRTFISNAN